MSTVWLNHLYYLLGVLLMAWSEFGEQILPMIPEKYRHIVTVVIAVAMWFRSHQNLVAMPPGATEAAADAAALKSAAAKQQ